LSWGQGLAACRLRSLPRSIMAGAITVAVMAGVITVEVITMEGVEATTMDKAIITISENVIW
jgi:hypothetical protein